MFINVTGQSAHPGLNRPRAIWTTYFNLSSDNGQTTSSSDLPAGVYPSPGLSYELGFTPGINEAEALFKQVPQFVYIFTLLLI